MYIPRKIDSYLNQWKSDAIRTFAHANYRSVIEISFFEEPIYKTITGNGYSVNEIIKAISLLNEIIKAISLIDPAKEFIPGDTLIFFDEPQEFPRFLRIFDRQRLLFAD